MPEKSLGGISAYARGKNGYTFCTCSVNQYFCNHRHAQYRLETPAEFRRYLPLAIASFATGNNIWGETSRGDGGGTNTTFMKRVTEAYGLYFTLTKDSEQAIAALAAHGLTAQVTQIAVSRTKAAGNLHLLMANNPVFLIVRE